MGADRSRFAGGDQRYLKEEQYGDTSRLAARTSLHLAYGTAAVPWFEWVHRAAAIPSTARVLEVGCGEGRLWESAPQGSRGVPLTLVDLSAAMVIAARGRALGSAMGRAARGVVADVGRLPFRPASFDVVIANHMLYHATDPASAVTELARLLPGHGRLVAATNGPRHLAEFGELRAAVFGTPPLDDTVVAFGIETGSRMLEAAFELVEWVEYEDRLVCTSPEDVLAYLGSVPPGEGATPAQDALMEDAVRERFARGGGSMVVSKETGVFLCQGPRRT